MKIQRNIGKPAYSPETWYGIPTRDAIDRDEKDDQKKQAPTIRSTTLDNIEQPGLQGSTLFRRKGAPLFSG